MKETLKKLLKYLPLEGIRFHIFSLSGMGLIRYYPIRKIVEYFWSFLKSDFVEISGHKIFLDSKDSLFLSIDGNYDSYETEIAHQQIKKGNIVLDIGANIGFYTLIFAKLVGDKGKVIAFEPEPSNFGILKKNVETNGYKNVILVPKAVSDKNGEIKLYLSSFSNAIPRIHKSDFCDRSIEIESVRLDDYLKTINFQERIDFIKIDVEGAEVKVLEGMRSTIQKNNNVKILVEFAPVSIKESGYAPEKLLEMLKGNGFNLQSINSKARKLEPVNTKQLLKSYTARKKNFINLLCSKQNITKIR